MGAVRVGLIRDDTGTEQGVASGTDAQVGIYADRAVTLVMEDFARALVRTKDHRLHASYPRAPAVWSSAGAGAGGSRAPMWSLELADEPYLAHALLVAQQQRSEREERRKRKIRMTDLAARKALATATGGAAVGSQRGGATGAGPRDGSAAPRNSVVNDGGTATAAGSPADTTAPSPLPNAPANRGKTADEKAATKAQRDATKRAKDEGVAGSKKKPVKEPDVNAANRSMTTHLAGVGKKRTFAWMPDTEGGALGGTLNAKFSLGGSKKRKMGGGGVAPPIDMPWKPGGKAGLGKLGVGKAGAAGDASGGDGSRGATAGGRIDLGAEHGSIAHLVHGQDTAFPPLADTITGRDVKATLERFISRGGPTKQLFVRRWEEALLVIAREEQALAKHQAAEVTTVFKIPPCHPGDEKAMKQAEEAAENRAAAAAAAAATTAAGAAGAAGAGPL